MIDPPRLPPKREVALSLLEGASVFAHIDPRRPDVVVPKWLRNQSQLVLQVGMNMPVPIPDLRVEDDGISCTLSFNRSPFWCFLPWTAVYALVGEDGRGMVWPEDVPNELAEQNPRPQLSVVQTERDESGDEPQDETLVESDPAPADESSDSAPAEESERTNSEPAQPDSEPAQPDSEPAQPDSEPAQPDSSEPSQGTEDGPGEDGKKKRPSYLRVIK